MNIYSGYVYLWYDTKSKFFYIGGHHGTVEDNYICSSVKMLQAYKKRPGTFKFKVLQYVNGTTHDLRVAEQYWLNMIKDSELYWTENIYAKTCRYYNQKKVSAGGNGKANLGKKHKNKGWMKGYSREEREKRSQGLYCFVPLDAPVTSKSRSYPQDIISCFSSDYIKRKYDLSRRRSQRPYPANRPILYECIWCGCHFIKRSYRKYLYCSTACGCRNAKKMQELKRMRGLDLVPLEPGTV